METPGIKAEARPELLALGPLPPPVTGMTLFTERIIEQLKAAGPVTFFNWSPQAAGRRWLARWERLARSLGCLARMVRRGRVRQSRLYIVAASRKGLLMTGILASLGRRLGYRVYIHHHTYFYIDCYDWRMAWIDRTLGPQGTHVVHCREMEEHFRARYATQCRFEHLLPSVFALPIAPPREAAATPFRIGYMSNLSIEKGLDLVLETLRRLIERGRAVRLRIAGPTQTDEAGRLVQCALQEHPEKVEYVGPVYGQSKADYFQSIDCFVFPSRSESWGIVLNEAMAAGAPTVAMDRGCSSVLVGDAAGLLIADEAQFAEQAAQQIELWIDSADEFRKASHAAVERASELNQCGQQQLDQFAQRMFASLTD